MSLYAFLSLVCFNKFRSFYELLHGVCSGELLYNVDGEVIAEEQKLLGQITKIKMFWLKHSLFVIETLI